MSMERAKFKERMKALKAYKDETGKGYWDWKVQAFNGGGGVNGEDDDKLYIGRTDQDYYGNLTHTIVRDVIDDGDEYEIRYGMPDVVIDSYHNTNLRTYNYNKEVAKNVTDAASFVPGVGEVIDATIAAQDASEGDYTTAAGLGLGLLIPNVIEKSAKWLWKSGKGFVKNLQKNRNLIKTSPDRQLLEEIRELPNESTDLQNISHLDDSPHLVNTSENTVPEVSAAEDQIQNVINPPATETHPFFSELDDIANDPNPLERFIRINNIIFPETDYRTAGEMIGRMNQIREGIHYDDVEQALVNFYNNLNLNSNIDDYRSITSPFHSSMYTQSSDFVGNVVVDEARRSAVNRLQTEYLREISGEMDQLTQRVNSALTDPTVDYEELRSEVESAIARRNNLINKDVSLEIGFDRFSDDGSQLRRLLSQINGAQSISTPNYQPDVDLVYRPPKSTIESAFDPNNLPEGFDDLNTHLNGEGQGIRALAYFNMSPEQAFKQANWDFAALGHGDVFNITDDFGLSTDSYPLSLMMMARHQNKGLIIPKILKDGKNQFQILNDSGKTRKKLRTGEVVDIPSTERLKILNNQIRKFNKNTGLNLPDAYYDDAWRRFVVPSVGFRRYTNGGVVPEY